MSVQTVKFALKMGKKTVVFEPKSKRHMIRLVKAALTTNGAQARAVEVIKGINALVEKEGMVYPSQTKQAIADKARRKSRSIRALDCAMFIQTLPGTDNLEGYNLALASFMEENNEGNHATAKTIQVANGEGAEYPVMSADLADFAEMRKNGGRYTKAIAASRKARLKAAQKRKDDAADRREARRARNAERADRRFEAFLERRSRGLVEAKKYSLPKAIELALAVELKGERKANRKVRKMAEALLERIQEAIENFAVNAEFSVQNAARFNGKRLFAKERTMVEEFEVNPLKATDLESLVDPHELRRTVLDKDGNKVKALKLNKEYTVEYTMVYAGPDVGTIETCVFPLGSYLSIAEGIC